MCSRCNGRRPAITLCTIRNHLARDQAQLAALPSPTTDSYLLLESHILGTSDLLRDIQGGYRLLDLMADQDGSPSEGQGMLLFYSSVLIFAYHFGTLVLHCTAYQYQQSDIYPEAFDQPDSYQEEAIEPGMSVVLA